MIVFAAHTPHTPLLLETVAKAHAKKLADTRHALERLAEELALARPDAIVIFSGHGPVHEEAFSLNLHDPYHTDLSAFGDLGTQEAFRPALRLIDALQRGLRRAGLPLTLDSDPILDYGSAVPLLALTRRLKRLPIVPIAPARLPPKEHHAFGKALKDLCATAPERVALLSTGDLSHALSVTSPNGYKEEGPAFDEAMLNAVEHVSASTLLNLDEEIVREAAECGYRPLTTLFGALDGSSIEPEILCYEAPFGVGYLTAQFHFRPV